MQSLRPVASASSGEALEDSQVLPGVELLAGGFVTNPIDDRQSRLLAAAISLLSELKQDQSAEAEAPDIRRLD
jgi:hypothetical protein